jgi:hypothetical protein
MLPQDWHLKSFMDYESGTLEAKTVRTALRAQPCALDAVRLDLEHSSHPAVVHRKRIKGGRPGEPYRCLRNLLVQFATAQRSPMKRTVRVIASCVAVAERFSQRAANFGSLLKNLPRCRPADADANLAHRNAFVVRHTTTRMIRMRHIAQVFRRPMFLDIEKQDFRKPDNRTLLLDRR